jgi:ribonuclease HI
MTNNVAKYEAHINGLRIAIELRVQRLYFCGDSELIVN